MSNPYIGTPDETAWDQGYSQGWYYPDADPSPPAPLAEDATRVFREGALAGKEAVAGYNVSTSIESQQAGPSMEGGYSSPGASDGGGTITIPETTVVGDPNSAVDPNSADDAYGTGWDAGTRGLLEDPSAFSESVRARYHQGYSEGAGWLRTNQHEHSGAEEVAHGLGHVAVPVVLDHWVLHAILKGAPFMDLIALATSPGGDTLMHPPDAFMAVCHRHGHNYHGDPVFDGGAWHGVVTIDYNAARSEGDEHGRSSGHTDDVYVWTYNKDNEWMWID
ncbi:MAG: hypothetical protein ABIQ73_29200 [Acidimicrobiales bacterium]